MKVFVTGGSGFVGGHVIEALAKTHEVLAMARSERSAAVVEGFGATAVRCSLDDVSAAHLEGVDAVVHAAAYVEEWGRPEDYWSANVDGTQRLLDAARAAGVARFVAVSTNATVFDGRGQQQVDESWAYADDPRFPYGVSKAEAERRVLGADAEGFTTVALRPCFVWGPRDNTVLPAVVRMVEDGTFVWLDQGRAVVSTTHVHNLVHAVQRALVSGQGGRAYFVTDGDDTTLRRFIGDLARTEGLDVDAAWSVPGRVVVGAAAALEATWRALGWQTTPPVTRMAALLMSADMTVVDQRAREELGYLPVVRREEGLRQLGRGG
jgi:nucleoside-diphosphate-sugar epimerase